MNTNMSNKYHKMHIDLLTICEDSGIKPIAGKRVSYDALNDSLSSGLKDLILLPEDMKKFRAECTGALSELGYIITEGKSKSGSDAGFIRIYGQDVLATTIPSLMTDPDGNHGPQFIIRELSESGDRYSFTANKTTFTFDRSHISDLIEVAYTGSTVYMIRDVAEHIRTIYDEDPAKGGITSGYGIFEADCSSEEFIREAERRGYLSQKNISAYKKHRAWKKENRKGIEEKYRAYQDLLLGLKAQE